MLGTKVMADGYKPCLLWEEGEQQEENNRTMLRRIILLRRAGRVERVSVVSSSLGKEDVKNVQNFGQGGHKSEARFLNLLSCYFSKMCSNPQ